MKNKRLCEWNKSEINGNIKLLFSIVKNPDKYCKKCARVANKESYLCKSEKIKDD